MSSRLARFGIQGGQRVALGTDDALARSVPGSESAITESNFAARALQRLGWGEICDRIQSERPLSEADTIRLLDEAPFAVLLKLVELRAARDEFRSVAPLLFLNLQQWPDDRTLFEQAERVLGYLDDPRVEVLISGLSRAKLQAGVAQELRRFALLRPGITIVGPSIEQLVRWIGEESSPSITVPQLVRELREAGIGRLAASRDLRLLRQLPDIGMGSTVCTPFDRHLTCQAVAAELIRLRDLCLAGASVDVWFPGFSSPHHWTGRDQSAVDLQILRGLCVGTLLLPGSIYRRASSQYLSLDGMRFARLCGANDLGFGAVDSVASAHLNLMPYAILRKAVGEGNE